MIFGPVEVMFFPAGEDEARAFFQSHATITWQKTPTPDPVPAAQPVMDAPPVTEGKARFPALNPASIVTAPQNMRANSIVPVKTPKSSRRTSKPDANQLRLQLLQSLPCHVVNEDLFIFNGLFYSKTSQNGFTRIAKWILRQQGIGDVPMAIFAEVYRQIITDPDLSQEEEYFDDGFVTFRNGTSPSCFQLLL